MITAQKWIDNGGSCRSILLIMLACVALVVPCISQNTGDQTSQQSQSRAKVTLTTPPDNPLYFFGDFAEETFSSHWKLENSDKEKYAFHPRKKSILIVTQEGALFNSRSLKNRLVLNKDLPSGDFTVVIEALFYPIENDRLAIALFADEQNYFELSLRASRNETGLKVAAMFERKTQGQLSSVVPRPEPEEWGLAALERHIRLKIERQGSLYIGSYKYVTTRKEKNTPTQNEKDIWIPVGTLARVQFGGKLELMAYSHLSEQEGSVEFCSVKIIEPATEKRSKASRLFFLIFPWAHPRHEDMTVSKN